jgi:hypothetical protein
MKDEFIGLTHREWRVPVSEMGVRRYSVDHMTGLVEKNKEDLFEIDLKKPISEMITTDQGSMDLLEKVRVDVDFGLADTPLLYQSLYDFIPGPFPGGAVQLNENTLQANVVFLQKFEGGEVVFGTLAKGVPAVVTLQTYAAGFEWTEDMVVWDRTWEISLNNRAFGRAYNQLLNHLHLSPIIGFSYTGANQTPANTTGATLQEDTLLTFKDAYKTSVMATPQRTPSVILANEGDRFQIEDALLKMKEFVQHDLRIDIGPADISRLIEGQQVGRARRGLYADINDSVEEITLPT